MTARCNRTWITGGGIRRSGGLSARHAGPCFDFGAPSSASPPPEQRMELPGGPPPSLVRIDDHLPAMHELVMHLLTDVGAAARDETLPAEVRAELVARLDAVSELLAAVMWPGGAQNSSRFEANRTASFGYLGPACEYEGTGDERVCYAVLSREHERPITNARCSPGQTYVHEAPPFTLAISPEKNWTLAGDWVAGCRVQLRDVAKVRTEREEGGSIAALWPMASVSPWVMYRLSLDTAAAICGVTGARLELPDGTVLTATAPEEAATQPPSLWTMQSARAFVADKLWGLLYDAGWVPCITGGVLRDGKSTNDLDVILYPRFGESDVGEATRALATWIPPDSWAPMATGLFASFEVGARRVEVVIPC